MKILLVDDETHILRVIGDFLADCGHQTVSAGDGAQALKLLETHSDIDLVVSDIRMPKMDGLAFLRAVRVRFPGIPVILITGHGDETVAVSALQEGAFDYLKKPIKLSEFLDCIDRVEERTRLETQILTNYQDFLQTREMPETRPGTSGKNKEVQTDKKAILENCQALEAFWETLGGYVRNHMPQDRAEGRRLTFILDETPGLLADLCRRVERLSGSEKAPKPEHPVLQESAQMAGQEP